MVIVKDGKFEFLGIDINDTRNLVWIYCPLCGCELFFKSATF